MLKIRFDSGESDMFYITLTKRVNEYFVENRKSKYASTGMKLKVILLLLLMGTFYFLMFKLKASYPLILTSGFFFGSFSFFTCLNIGHDAAHGALSANKYVNRLSLYVMNLVGINSYIWRIKHVFAHHTFPNVMGTDSDIGRSKIGRIIPGAKWKWFCKYQQYYVPFLYLFYSAHWVLFKDFANFRKLNIPNKGILKHPFKEYIILVIGKLFALTITFLVPLICLKISILQAVILYFVMHIGPGLCVALFLAPGHLNSHVVYPVPDENGILHTSWAKHQVITAIDFSNNNSLFNFLLGGFNHHISHHLFPQICHCHYPDITPIIRETAQEYNIDYKSTTFKELLKSHFDHLKKMSIREFEYEVI